MAWGAAFTGHGEVADLVVERGTLCLQLTVPGHGVVRRDDRAVRVPGSTPCALLRSDLEMDDDLVGEQRPGCGGDHRAAAEGDDAVGAQGIGDVPLLQLPEGRFTELTEDLAAPTAVVLLDEGVGVHHAAVQRLGEMTADRGLSGAGQPDEDETRMPPTGRHVSSRPSAAGSRPRRRRRRSSASSPPANPRRTSRAGSGR